MTIQTVIDLSNVITTTLYAGTNSEITTAVNVLSTSISQSTGLSGTIVNDLRNISTSLSSNIVQSTISTELGVISTTITSTTSQVILTSISPVGPGAQGDLPSDITVDDFVLVERGGVTYRVAYNDFNTNGDVVTAYTKLIDTVSPNLLYKGEALPGSVEGAATWRISRIEIIGEDITEKYAGGSSAFMHIWDDREVLDYQ